MTRAVALAAIVAAAFTGAPAAASAATPQPGLWVGKKGSVQLSFTVRAAGSRRTVTDVVTACGTTGSLEEGRSSPAADPTPNRFAVRASGTIARWAGPKDRRPVLGATSGTVDSRTITGGCPIADHHGIRMHRGDFRPFQDGEYAGKSGDAYDFLFEVVGGGTLVRRLRGYAGVPDSTSLSGFCGPGGAIGQDSTVAADGSFVSDDGPGRDSRLVISGRLGGTSVLGSYTYTASKHCVGPDPLSGTVSWAAALTKAAPGAAPVGGGAGTQEPTPLPPGPEGAPDAPDPKPAPNNGYGGPPPASPQAGCKATVNAGPLAAIASCFTVTGTKARSGGRVRLNGIDLTPARAGVHVTIDTRTFAVTSDGPVELRIGSLSLVRSSLSWKRPDATFKITGESKGSDPGQDFRTKGQSLFGLPLKGSAEVRLEGGRTKLTVSLSIPKDDGPALSRLSGYSGELTAAADNQSGLVLDGAKLTFPGMRAGFVEIQSAQVAVSQVGKTYHFDGGATIFPFRLNRIGFSGTFGFGLGDGYFKLGAAVEQLNRSLVYGFFLQKLGFELRTKPFGISGSAGVTFGPQFRLGGDLISAARLDGTLAYLSASGSDPASLTLSGALELAEAKAADGSVEVRGDGSVTAKGTFELTVGGYGLKGGLDGWFDGTRAFNVEGRAALALPGPDGSGDAVLSSVGVGACRHGLGPDVGFGYTWGKGVSGIRFAAGSCSLGAWRAERATRAAAPGVRTVLVPPGRRQLAVQVTGAQAAPVVAVVDPAGRRIVPSAAPGGEAVDASTLLVQDPDTRSTYLVADRPRPGTWRIETQPGSVPVTAVRTAEPLPTLTVRGSVRRAGAARIVRFRARGLAGRRLQLVDVAGRTRRALRTTGAAAGTVRFTPAASAGMHRIVAVVLGPDGVPTGRQRTVARYRTSAAPPKAPRRVRVLHVGSGRRVTWTGSASMRYEVDVTVSDGRRLRLLPRGRRRAVTVPIVPRGVTVRATVRARDAAGRLSRPAHGRG